MLIAFVGSVFSPYYAAARWCGTGEARAHVALNVALSGPHTTRWAMTERGGRALTQTADRLRIGPSELSCDGTDLVFRIEEVTAPVPSRIRGEVRVRPAALFPHVYALDAGGRHSWQPIAPRARVEVALERPDLRWSGDGYLDINRGKEPLERRFRHWTWARAHAGRGAVVVYDCTDLDDAQTSIALRFADSGTVEAFDPPPCHQLSRSRWRVPRTMRSEPGHPPRLERTFEDGPFYTRALVRARLCGEDVTAMHESLSCDRFRQRWVQALLPFRMPRTPLAR